MKTVAETMGLTFFVPSRSNLNMLPPLSELSQQFIATAGWPDLYTDDLQDYEHRSYDLSFTFRTEKFELLTDVFFAWFKLMELQSQNLDPHKEDIESLGYTCSIYRVLLDPTTTITKWAKAAGCFPVSTPIGDVFNYDGNNIPERLDVPFKANQIRYLDPIDLVDIERLVTSS